MVSFNYAKNHCIIVEINVFIIIITVDIFKLISKLFKHYSVPFRSTKRLSSSTHNSNKMNGFKTQNTLYIIFTILTCHLQLMLTRGEEGEGSINFPPRYY